MNYMIDFDKDIFSIFQYFQELTETERGNQFHGGKLYDIDEYGIGADGNYSSFWFSPGGIFAVEFSDEMKSGVYVYELYQYIGNQYVSDTIFIAVE